MIRLLGIAVTVVLAACTTYPNYRSLAKQVLPTVVELYAVRINPLSERVEERTYCTGVAISSTHILTAGHCIALTPEEFKQDGKVFVKTRDGKKYLAKIEVVNFVDSEEEGEGRDSALLMVEGADLKYAELGDSATVQVGDTLAIVGNTFGELTYSFATGTVAAVNRKLSGESFIQASVEVRGGNSGGPAFDMDGKVIGIVVRADGAGISFIEPLSHTIAQIMEKLHDKSK